MWLGLGLARIGPLFTSWRDKPAVKEAFKVGNISRMSLDPVICFLPPGCQIPVNVQGQIGSQNTHVHWLEGQPAVKEGVSHEVLWTP
jgi:hypothetical protein